MKILGKCAVTALMLWLVFRSIDVVAVARMLSTLDPLWALATVLLTALMILCDAALFSRTMRLLGWHMPFGVASLYSLVGWFFGNLAPASVGGDIFRGAQLSRVGTPVGVAVRSIVAMRLISFATLFLVMLAGFPIAIDLARTQSDVALLAFVLASSGGALAALGLFARFPLPQTLIRRWPVLAKVNTISGDVGTIVKPTVDGAVAWLAALAQHLLRVAIVAALAVGLGLNVSTSALFAVVPAALLAAMLPISLGGWGVREVSFVYFLGTAGISGEAALSLSIAFGLLKLLTGVVGGVVWALVGKDSYRVEAHSANPRPAARQ